MILSSCLPFPNETKIYSSEEGTRECTNILLQMSWCHISFRIQVLDELIAGASAQKVELKNRTKAEQEKTIQLNCNL